MRPEKERACTERNPAYEENSDHREKISLALQLQRGQQAKGNAEGRCRGH